MPILPIDDVSRGTLDPQPVDPYQSAYDKFYNQQNQYDSRRQAAGVPPEPEEIKQARAKKMAEDYLNQESQAQASLHQSLVGEFGQDVGSAIFKQKYPNAQIPSQAAQPVEQPSMQLASMEQPEPQVQLAADVRKPETLNLQPQIQNRLEGLEDAYTMQQIGMTNAAQAGEQKAVEQAAMLRKQQEEMQRLQAEQQLNEQKRQETLAAEHSKLNQSIEEYGNLQVDPKRLYKNMDTGDKVFAAIGLILGAFGKNGNTAVDVLQNAINRDIDAQKADMAVKGDQLNAKKGIYSQMMARFGDERQAEAATRLAYLQNAQLKTQEIESRYKAPEIKANAQMLYGQLEAQKQAALAQFAKTAEANIMLRQGDPTNALIQRLPESERTNAIKELNAYKEAQSTKEDIKRRFYGSGGEGGVKDKKGFLNLPWSADQASVDTFNASLFPAVKKIAGEKLTDGDAERMINPHMMQRGDSVKRMEEKLAGLMQSLDDVSKTPTLDRYGISPPTSRAAKEKLGVGAPVRVSK